MDRLDTLVYQLIHRGQKDIEELAELLGVSTNYLYKMGLPEENGSHSPIGLRRLIAIMKAQKDDSIARYMAQRFGAMFVKLPRVARNRMQQSEMVADYQKTASEAVQMMIDYINNPTSQELRARLIGLMLKMAEKSVAIQKRLEHDGQFNLFEE